jgi:hypothetical protein
LLFSASCTRSVTFKPRTDERGVKKERGEEKAKGDGRRGRFDP